MKVTVICEVLGKANNGTSIAAYNLINYLKSKGHQVNVVCPDKDKQGEDGYYILPKANLGKMMDKIFEKNDVNLPNFDEKIVYEAIKDADVVHIMMPLFIARKASKFVKSVGKPLTAGFHAQAENFTAQFHLLNSKLANHLVYKWYDKNIFCRADGIHYPTQFIRDIFEKNVNRKTNGYVISNGVNDRFKPNPCEKDEKYKDKFCILFTGRLSKEKSHKVLLKAVSKSKYKDKIQLFFAGEGPTYKKIVDYSKKHLVNQPIINFYSRDELLKLINSCDLYCHPAVAEIEAIACLEAIACGLVPLIANSSKCATKGFAIDERSLFKVGNSKDLAKKIDYFIEHPEEKAKLREAYLQARQNYDHTTCMEKMEQMLIEVANKGKK